MIVIKDESSAKYLLYWFQPQRDITAYELSICTLILDNYRSGSLSSGTPEWQEVKQHFSTFKQRLT